MRWRYKAASRWLIALLCAFLTQCLAAQEPGNSPEGSAVTVCIAQPVNVPAGGFNPDAERNQIIRNVEQAQGKQPLFRIAPVALTTADSKRALSDARERNCEFVVLATLSVNTAASSTIGTRGGVQSSVRVPAGVHPTPDVNIQYSILQASDGKPTSKGTVMGASAGDTGDISAETQQALQDLAHRIVKDIENRKAPPVQ